ARVIAPQHTRQHAAARHGDVFRAVPGGKAVVATGGHGKGLLPPAVQAFAVIGADDERTVAGFAAGFLLLKLRANLLARRGGCPPVRRGSVNLKRGPKEPGESDEESLHLHELLWREQEGNQVLAFARK